MSLLAASLASLLGCQAPVHCVAAGTQVSTPNGPVAIESLKPGDEVLSMGEGSRPTIGRVTAVHEGMARNWLDLTLEDGSGLLVTEQHRVATESGWVEGRELREDLGLRGMDGSARVTSIDRVRNRARAFDLSVTPEENYFANGVLVHNKSVAPRPFVEDIVGRWASLSRYSHRPSRVFEFEDGGGRLIYASYFKGAFDILVYRIDEWTIDGYLVHIRATLLYAPEWSTRDEAWMDRIRSQAFSAYYKDGVLEIEHGSLYRMDFLEKVVAQSGEMAAMADQVEPNQPNSAGD